MKKELEKIYQGIRPEDYGLISKAIMHHSKDGLFITDNRGVVAMVNRATEEMCSITASQVLGRNVRDLVKEGLWNPSVALEVIKTGRIVSLLQTTHNDKRLLSTGIPIFNSRNELRYVLVNDRDITFLNHMAAHLEKDVDAARNIHFDLAELGLAEDVLKGVVVRSAAMTRVMQTAIRASKFDIPLVLTGESGVGKSMIARLVHELSQRHNGPFVDLNCGAIAANLLESELFGYAPGAFTGASTRGKTGILAGADQGTLFLDEISEIPPALQVKLLKFLETGQILPVGSTSVRKIKTRIITATNRNLEEMVGEGTFRSDLYFRLNVVPIHIPPLRERKEEIEALAQRFMIQFNEEFGTHKVLSKTARQTLSQYSFPGNVRELENLVKRLVTMTEGDYIREKHLPAMLLEALPCETDCSLDEVQTYQDAVAAFERKMILSAIEKYGSQRKAAKALGINQSTLSRKLKT